MSKIEAQIFDFFITQRCTMNCKLCAAAVPYVKNPVHTPKEVAFRELKEFFNVWDYAHRLEFIGGEPLMHPEITDIVKEALKYSDKFAKMRITTNATIVPSDELCDIASHCGKEFDFIVDDYGENSRNLEPLIRKLESYGIPYRVDVYHGKEQRFGGWIFFGDHTLINDDDGAAKAYESCICPKNQFVCTNKGKAFSCVYAMGMNWVNGFHENDGSYIDLFDDSVSIEEKRKIAANFCKQPITACKYCHGFDSENSQRYPGPPEQMPRRLIND